jgi:hypothetical protein
MSYNLWVYVNGNPVNYTDPSGYCLIVSADSGGNCVYTFPSLNVGGIIIPGPTISLPSWFCKNETNYQQQPWVFPAQTQIVATSTATPQLVTPTVTPQPFTPTPASVQITSTPIQTQIYITPSPTLTQTPRPIAEKEPFCWEKYLGTLGSIVQNQIRCDQKVREISISGVINLVRNGNRFQVNFASEYCPNADYCNLINILPPGNLEPGEYYESRSWGSVWYIYQGQNHGIWFDGKSGIRVP